MEIIVHLDIEALKARKAPPNPNQLGFDFGAPAPSASPPTPAWAADPAVQQMAREWSEPPTMLDRRASGRNMARAHSEHAVAHGMVASQGGPNAAAHLDAANMHQKAALAYLAHSRTDAAVNNEESKETRQLHDAAHAASNRLLGDKLPTVKREPEPAPPAPPGAPPSARGLHLETVQVGGAHPHQSHRWMSTDSAADGITAPEANRRSEHHFNLARAAIMHGGVDDTNRETVGLHDAASRAWRQAGHRLRTGATDADREAAPGVIANALDASREANLHHSLAHRVSAAQHRAMGGDDHTAAATLHDEAAEAIERSDGDANVDVINATAKTRAVGKHAGKDAETLASEIDATRQQIAAHEAAVARASAARRRLPAGSSRARVTTADANWANAAEARDKAQDRLDDLEATAATRQAAPGPKLDPKLASSAQVGDKVTLLAGAIPVTYTRTPSGWNEFGDAKDKRHANIDAGHMARLMGQHAGTHAPAAKEAPPTDAQKEAVRATQEHVAGDNAESLVRRAVAAGADAGSIRYFSAGGEGVLFRDKTGRVFKVGRLHGVRNGFNDGDILNPLQSEAEAGAALAEHGLAPRVHRYDKDHDVIVRDHVEGRHGSWADASKLWDHHQGQIAKTLREAGFTRPEFKEDSYIFGADGSPKIVDVGFTTPMGKRLAAKLRSMEITPSSPRQFDIQMEVNDAVEDGALTYPEARDMIMRLKPEMQQHGMSILNDRAKRLGIPKYRAHTETHPSGLEIRVHHDPSKTAGFSWAVHDQPSAAGLGAPVISSSGAPAHSLEAALKKARKKAADVHAHRTRPTSGT